MGSLKELHNEDCNVHMCMSTSGVIDIYVHDTLKNKCSATLEEIIDVNTKGDFPKMLQTISMQPFTMGKWFVIMTYSAVKSQLEAHKGILDSENACFLFKVKNYREYKSFKELYEKVNDLYMTVIRYKDVKFLLEPYEIPESVIDFVAKSYSREPEKVFTLYTELKNGLVIENKREVVKILGASSGSINHFALKLLEEYNPTSERGLRTVYKNRIKTASELSQAYGLATFRNFLMASVKDIMTVKELYISGCIYDRIKGIPEVFNENKLSRYNYYLDTINRIPYERVARLWILLKKQGIWQSPLDLFQFMYEYYGGINN